MRYKKLGKTGLEVSELGLGCEHLDNKPFETAKEVIDTALDSGVNIFDVFMPGKEVRENIMKALGPRRKDVIIQGHIGSTDVNQQYDISREMPLVKKYFEDMLRVFGKIELGMLFFIDSEKDYSGVFDTEFISYVERLKKDGYIDHIGFSSHNPAIAAKVIRTGVPEMMMFSINPAFDMLPAAEYVFDHMDKQLGKELLHGIDPQRAELYSLCESEDIGITVMKSLGAGKLLLAEQTPFAKPLTVQQCMHYALTRPSVASVMLGCKNKAEVFEGLKYFDTPAEELDYTEVLSTMHNDFRGNCVYCSHCQPCPSGIDIAIVNKYLDIAKLDVENIAPSIKQHYKALDHSGIDCIKCGSCEARCPFGVPIIKNMELAEILMRGADAEHSLQQTII